MKNSKSMVVVSVVVAALAITPMVVSNLTDKKIEEYKAMLASHGLKQEILKKEGYFTSKRDFTIEVVDASKAVNFLLDKTGEKIEQYRPLIKIIKEESKPEEINSALNGLKFRGQLEHSNLLPADRKASLIWDRLPSSTTDEEVKAIFNPLLAKGVFALDITFDAGHKVKQVVARDIKEKISAEDATIDINTVGHKLDLSEGSDSTKGRLEMAKQVFQVAPKNPADGNMTSDLEKLVYSFNYKDYFNNDGTMSTGKYSFAFTDIQNDDNVKLGFSGMKIDAKGQDKSDKLYFEVGYLFDNFFFVDGIDDFAFKTFSAKLGIDGLSTPKVKKLQKIYNDVQFGVQTTNSNELEANMMSMINDGVKLTLNAGLKGLTSPISAIKDATVDATVELQKNNFNKGQSPLMLLSLLDVNAKIKIHKEDRVAIEALGFLSKRQFDLGVAKDEYLVYDVVMKNGALTLNGQPLQ